MSIWIFTCIMFIKMISLTRQSLLVTTSAQGAKSTCVQDCLCTKGTSVHWAFSGYRTSGMGVDQVAIEQDYNFIFFQDWVVGWEVGGWPIRMAQCCPTSESLSTLLRESLFVLWFKTTQPPLVTHLPALTGGSKEGLRVLVPLCGKAGCLNHLHKAGHDVVGEPQS